MTNWNRFKTFISKLDFADVRKDVADDLKKASFAMFALWLLALLPRLPVAFSVAPKLFGVDATAIQTSLWVTWLIFGFALVLYIAQVLLRVNVRKGLISKKIVQQNSNLESLSNGKPGRRGSVDGSSPDTSKNALSSLRSLFNKIRNHH